MKIRITFIAIALMLFAGSLQAQQQQQINNLATFAKVWGFLKYYHPEVAKGHPDWDAEWLKIGLTITKVEGKENFNNLIIRWYSSLPKAKLSTNITQISSDSIFRVFEEKEIKRYNIPASIKQDLLKLFRYHRPDSSKYINNKDRGYTYDYIFHNEDPLDQPLYPDMPHRLLALVRFWNIINYFYPHKAEKAPNWDKVLTDFIPQFMNAANADEYRETFLRLTTTIRDSHSWFVQNEWNAAHGDFLNAPFDTYYVKGKFVIGYSKYDSLMKAANFKIGDEITAINNTPVAERVRQIEQHATGSNQQSYYRDMGRNLFRIDSTKRLQITINRNGQLLKKAMQLYTYPELFQYRVKHRPTLWQNLGNGIWYVRICEIGDVSTLQKMYNDIKDAKTVIWEMRDYPSFKIVQAMFPGLMANRIDAATDYEGVLEFPGSFIGKPEHLPASADTLKLPLFKGRLIVLVNEFTQSLAESVAMELRARPNTIIMGRQTAGATGNMVRVSFPGGITASYTGVRVIGINDSFKQGQGVKLDKKIALSINKMRSQPDYELEQAYQLALKDN